ncbi:MAG: DUF2798 domain-containing protein [Betaproteobacteria bacterium]
MGFLMSATLTFIYTVLHHSLSSDFLMFWIKMWIVAYPLASLAIILYRPSAMKITQYILERVRY